MACVRFLRTTEVSRSLETVTFIRNPIEDSLPNRIENRASADRKSLEGVKFYEIVKISEQFGGFPP
jgi:hypothetical protein